MVVAETFPGQIAELYPGDIKSVLLTEEQIKRRIAELAAQIGDDYRDVSTATGQDLLLVTVLKGAVLFVTDLARAIPLPTQFEFMAVSSYGSSTSSSGVVRILKDLDRDIHDRDVLDRRGRRRLGFDAFLAVAQPQEPASEVAAGVHAAA